MSNWHDLLEVDTQRALEALGDYGCRLFWRENEHSKALRVPGERGMYFLEIWKRGRLLDFTSVQCPFDSTSQSAVMTLVTRQMHIHHLYNDYL